MIRAREALATLCTLERLLPGVSSVVTGELVRASEGPVASVPGTLEGFLSSVDSLMGLEVRALCVHLIAVWVVTCVHPFYL